VRASLADIESLHRRLAGIATMEAADSFATGDYFELEVRRPDASSTDRPDLRRAFAHPSGPPSLAPYASLFADAA
jgi:hypothetical protein